MTLQKNKENNSNPKRIKKSVLIGTLSVICLIITVFIGIFIYNKLQPGKQSVQPSQQPVFSSASPSLSPSPTPSPVTRSNNINEWKIYSNPQYGFQFIYPNDWTNEQQKINTSLQEIEHIEFYRLDNDPSSKMSIVSLTVYQNSRRYGNTPESYYKYHKDYQENYEKTNEGPAFGIDSWILTTLKNNIKVGELTYSGVDPGYELVFSNNKYLFEFSLPMMTFNQEKAMEIAKDIAKDIKQIISTFTYK